MYDIHHLKNNNGMEAKITNYGAILMSLMVPDRNGNLDDVVLGYKTVEEYIRDNAPHFGGIVGRYANRINKGAFTLDGRKHRLVRNDEEHGNHIHGGKKGFDGVVWHVEDRSDNHLTLGYLSRDGEEGYPGNLTVKVCYSLSDDNELKIEYQAVTDKETVVNLTHHSYFNLAGAGNGDVLGHELMIDADRFLPVDSRMIPTGKETRVKGTPMDFTESVAIGARIHENYEQLRLGNGYDHCFVLNGYAGIPKLAARVHEPVTGRVMEVHTTEPGLHLYTGNSLDGRHKGKEGKRYYLRHGLCLEAQRFPDSPNQPGFPTTVIVPHELYHQETVYRFCVK